jgi:hypothetical protein
VADSVSFELDQEAWVVEVFIPASLFAPRNVRGEVGSQAFEIKRGYYRISLNADRDGTPLCDGVLLCLEIAATSRVEAEDRALRVGNEFAATLTLYTGSPLLPARIRRAARIGSRGGVLEQHDYYYDDSEEPPVQVEAEAAYLDMLLRRLEALDTDRRDRLGLASRWYGISVASVTAVDSYVAAWIGLEAIGGLLDARFHPQGPRAACETCHHPPGAKRDRKFAGIEHAFRRIAPEVLAARAFDDLKRVRDQVVHGLRPLNEVATESEQLILDTQLVLATSFLAALQGPPGLLRAKLPRDFAIRPDARATIRPSLELLEHRPYVGGWIPLERTQPDFKSSFREEDGHYSWGAGVGLGYRVRAKGRTPTLHQSYTRFYRAGRTFEPGTTTRAGDPATPILQEEWRKRVMPPSWQRLVDAPEADRNT